MALAWGEFVGCGALIWLAGSRLSRWGDAIAEQTGLSRSFVGLLLLATVTSLPELVTGVSAAGLVGEPDLAVGNVLGACVLNLSMIGVLDFLQRGESVYTRASQGHILSAGFGVILIGFVGFNVLLGRHGEPLALGHVGVSAPILVVLYAVAMSAIYRYEHRGASGAPEAPRARDAPTSLREAIVRFALAGAVVVAAAAWLPFVGRELARAMGWHETFVGTILLGVATTLPELAVTVAALRLGQVDLAIGTLLGSNLFNAAMIALDDCVYLPGPILSVVSPYHGVSAMSATMMTGVAIVGLLYRPRTRLLKTVGWTSLFLFSMYLLNAYVLYLHAG
jgi:cation:H+ antiporter